MYSQIAFLKMTATKSAQETAADAVQLFGGRGITKSGMGRHIEHVSRRRKLNQRLKQILVQYHRTIAFDALLGGGEARPLSSMNQFTNHPCSRGCPWRSWSSASNACNAERCTPVTLVTKVLLFKNYFNVMHLGIICSISSNTLKWSNYSRKT